MYIIGAGMAGLLAGTIYQEAKIFESGDSLPNFHKAVFRMRSNRIGHYLGIPFEKVQVYKAIWFEGQERQITPRLAHYYSQKVTGKITQRSILNIESPVTRWIPPKDFIEQLAEKCSGRIIYNQKVIYISPCQLTIKQLKEGIDRIGEPIISTMPMPLLIKTLHDFDEYEESIKFDLTKIYINRFKIDNCNTYATIYYPEPETTIYRATIDGNVLITEGTEPLTLADIRIVECSFGLKKTEYKNPFKNQTHITSKIAPISTDFRQRIIYNATVGHGVYSLGRYATWRPGIMLDDVFNDIFVIKRLLNQGSYELKKYKQGE